MSLYFIGDIQGCDGALGQLLDKIDFSPSRDTAYLLGDLVNRGPASEATLRRLMGYGASARCLLGNHDLHLLAIAHGVRPLLKHDTVNDILHAPDRTALLDWLRQQHMAFFEHGCLMVHAGVLPSWTAEKTMALAAEVEAVLRSDGLGDFLQQMYGDEPRAWDDTLTGTARLRVVVNALTRLRFCTPEGAMEFTAKEAAGKAPDGHVPWFDAPNRQTENVTVAFGHWSTLGPTGRSNLLALDTGCVWGGCLSAWRLGSSATTGELVQIRCPQAQKPG